MNFDNYECDGQMNITEFLSQKKTPPSLSLSPYKAYYIAYENFTIETKRYMTAIWNKRGMALEFTDREHAQYFVDNHPEIFTGKFYEIRERIWPDYDQMELGNRLNKWEKDDD